jgi:hypothetical protein
LPPIKRLIANPAMRSYPSGRLKTGPWQMRALLWTIAALVAVLGFIGVLAWLNYDGPQLGRPIIIRPIIIMPKSVSTTQHPGASGDQEVSDSKIPPAPPGWNKTLSDLIAESKPGQHIGPPETEWARDYERSLLPPDVRFPRKGDIYEALEDMEIKYLTRWAAPFTGGGKAILKNGERIKVTNDPVELRPIGVYLEALDYPTLEERMVPSAERNSEKYRGFYFAVKTLDLNRRFRLIE